jgi:AmmeMemoRadiSam system protein B/AmmeMemoRadiSam system protein A
MTHIFGKVIITPSEKRKPSFAGSWYESNPQKLGAQLAGFLQSAQERTKARPCDMSFTDNTPVEGKMLAGIAPHAGYMFSGPTAAFVYDALRGRKISRVFLLGPSHYVALHGMALPVERAFLTPLGEIKVDQDVIKQLQDFPLFRLAPEIHRREHSLELQLPLIKQALGNVQIVPIIVGTLQDPQEMRLAGQILKRFVDNDDIVLVSSDFTHYGPRYDYVPFKEDAPRHVRELDEQAFAALRNCDLERFIAFREATRDTICGFYPACLLLSMLPEGTQASLLNYQTSRDIVETPDDNSVSYLAIVFSNKREEEGDWHCSRLDDQELSSEEKEALLTLTRHALHTYVKHGDVASAKETMANYPRLRRYSGAFVTLYRRPIGVDNPTRKDKDLRGCIGYIWPIKPLAEAVIDNVIGACSRDPRFVPVQEAELDGLQIDINVLTAPRAVKSSQEIEVGRDGVILYKNGKQAVFLPDVATEFAWSREELLTQLSLKAGCGKDGWQNNARFDVFQSQSFED